MIGLRPTNSYGMKNASIHNSGADELARLTPAAGILRGITAENAVWLRKSRARAGLTFNQTTDDMEFCMSVACRIEIGEEPAS